MNTIKAKQLEADEAKKVSELASRKYWKLAEEVHQLEESELKRKMALRVQEVLEGIQPRERLETWYELSASYICVECGPGPVAFEHLGANVVIHSNGSIELLDDSEPAHVTAFCENDDSHEVCTPISLDIVSTSLGDVLEADE